MFHFSKKYKCLYHANILMFIFSINLEAINFQNNLFKTWCFILLDATLLVLVFLKFNLKIELTLLIIVCSIYCNKHFHSFHTYMSVPFLKHTKTTQLWQNKFGNASHSIPEGVGMKGGYNIFGSSEANNLYMTKYINKLLSVKAILCLFSIYLWNVKF